MTLVEIRTQAVKVSGRADLVVDEVAYLDNGMDFYINCAQRWLDRRQYIKHADATYPVQLAVGQVGVSFPDCRILTEVYVQDIANLERTKLEKSSRTLVREYYNTTYGNTDVGIPLWYYPGIMRCFPDNPTMQQVKSYIGFDETMISVGQSFYNGIIIMPPPDIAYIVEVTGQFYTPAMVAETDTNVWASQHPNVLIWATLRELEISYRNSEGAKDWKASIDDYLLDLDKDVVEDELADLESQMEG